MLAREADVPVTIARNVVTMLKNECTVPFMARYRRDMTGNMDADDLRRVKDCYQHIKYVYDLFPSSIIIIMFHVSFLDAGV
jgi:transcriptional accessory protein Tex/SPT6